MYVPTLRFDWILLAFTSMSPNPKSTFTAEFSISKELVLGTCILNCMSSDILRITWNKLLVVARSQRSFMVPILVVQNWDSDSLQTRFSLAKPSKIAMALMHDTPDSLVETYTV